MFLKLKSVLFDYFKLVCKTIHLSSIGFGLTNIKQFLCLNMSICSRQICDTSSMSEVTVFTKQ